MKRLYGGEIRRQLVRHHTAVCLNGTMQYYYISQNLRNGWVESFFFSQHLPMRRTHLTKSKMASSVGLLHEYTYPACWFFKFISPDINGIQWAVGSHRSGNCTKTFTGYVVTAYNQSFTNRKEEKSRKKLQHYTSEGYSWKLGYCRAMSIQTFRFSIHCK